MAIDRWIDRPEPELATARDVRVAQVAARQHGVLSVEDLRACGLSLDAISVRAKNGRLHPMYKGVYSVGHPNPTRDGWLFAAVKACGPRAVLSHRAAAELHDIIEG